MVSGMCAVSDIVVDFFVLGIVAAALAVRGFSANGVKAEQRKARPAASGEHPKKIGGQKNE